MTLLLSSVAYQSIVAPVTINVWRCLVHCGNVYSDNKCLCHNFHTFFAKHIFMIRCLTEDNLPKKKRHHKTWWAPQTRQDMNQNMRKAHEFNVFYYFVCIKTVQESPTKNWFIWTWIGLNDEPCDTTCSAETQWRTNMKQVSLSLLAKKWYCSCVQNSGISPRCLCVSTLHADI